MEDIIKLLPESVSSRIAAGEVIQRPASVVKEMVENAVDAGASSVRIILTDAGRTLIQIIDDGCGMSESDARLAFQRHATSKISKAEDLYALSTFGFRGEALASVCAVADVQLRTRRAEDEFGTLVDVRAEEIVSQEPTACPVGCNFTVRNLFYNLPARRKFLKSNQTELSNILKEVERIALVHPEMSFSVWHQDSEILSLSASTLKQRIVALFGKNINKALLPVSTDTASVSISGFVGSLDSVRKKGAEQFFFVNGRYMRHPYFHKAVLEPYENLVPQGEQPLYFIFLEVPADSIDINVHPTKTEIKFSEEQLVWKIINAAVRETIGRYEGTTSIDFDTEGMPDIPIAVDDPAQVHQPKVSYNPSFNPFHSVNNRPSSSGNGNWTKLFDNQPDHKINDPVAYGSSPSMNQLPGMDVADAVKKKFFQHKGGYIVLDREYGLLVLDQHRAHIEVLYQRYLRLLSQGFSASQGLLFPEMLQLSASDAALLSDYQEDLAAFGFELSDMGHGAVAIQGIPEGLEDKNYSELLCELLHTAAEDGTLSTDTRRERLALSMARNAAIPSAKILSDAEITELIGDWEKCGEPRRTSDGKTLCFVIEDNEIARKL